MFLKETRWNSYLNDPCESNCRSHSGNNFISFNWDCRGNDSNIDGWKRAFKSSFVSKDDGEWNRAFNENVFGSFIKRNIAASFKPTTLLLLLLLLLFVLLMDDDDDVLVGLFKLFDVPANWLTNFCPLVKDDANFLRCPLDFLPFVFNWKDFFDSLIKFLLLLLVVVVVLFRIIIIKKNHHMPHFINIMYQNVRCIKKDF